LFHHTSAAAVSPLKPAKQQQEAIRVSVNRLTTRWFFSADQQLSCSCLAHISESNSSCSQYAGTPAHSSAGMVASAYGGACWRQPPQTAALAVGGKLGNWESWRTAHRAAVPCLGHHPCSHGSQRQDEDDPEKRNRKGSRGKELGRRGRRRAGRFCPLCFSSKPWVFT
jgi:hypothetical protein